MTGCFRAARQWCTMAAQARSTPCSVSGCASGCISGSVCVWIMKTCITGFFHAAQLQCTTTAHAHAMSVVTGSVWVVSRVCAALSEGYMTCSCWVRGGCAQWLCGLQRPAPILCREAGCSPCYTSNAWCQLQGCKVIITRICSETSRCVFAGTVSTGLLAGCPTMVVPFFGASPLFQLHVAVSAHEKPAVLFAGTPKDPV